MNKRIGTFTLARYLSAVAISQVGNVCVVLGIIFATNGVSSLSDSSGLIIAARSVGTLCALPAGGYLADRYNIPVALLFGLSGVVNAVLFLAIGVPFSLAILLVVVVISGVFEGFQGPAAAKYLLRLVDGVTRIRLNGINASLGGVARIGAPLIAGLLVSVVSPLSPILFASVSLVLAAVLIPVLTSANNVPPHDPSQLPRGPGRRATRLNFRRLTRDAPWLASYFIQTTLFQAAVWAPYGLLGPIVALQIYDSALGWSAVAGVYGLGVLLGGIYCAKYPPQRRKLAMILGSVGWALPVLALGASAPITVAMGASVLAGAGNALVASTWASTLQAAIPDSIYGKVVGFTTVGPALGAPIGSLIAGGALASDDAFHFLLGSGVIAILLPAFLVPFSWGRRFEVET